MHMEADPKIRVFGDNVIMATTGPIGYTQRLHHHLEATVKGNVFANFDAREATSNISKRFLTDIQESRAPMSPQEGIGFGGLIAAVMKDVPYLAEFATTNFQAEIKTGKLFFGSMGSGQMLADPFLAFVCRVLWGSQMPTVDRGKFGVYWVLEHTIKLAPGKVGPPIQLATLQKVGGNWVAKEQDTQESAQYVRALEEYIGHSIRQAIGASQGPALHFRTLDAARRIAVCTELAALPVKGFVVLSNKKNMEGYRNERVEMARPSSQEWFYNWCIKLLVERISDFVEYNSTKKFGVPKHVRLVFSERGGVRYGQTSAYHDLAKVQASSKTTLLTKRVVKWQVLHPQSNKIIAHTKNAGVQLADIIASSFYQAANAASTSWNVAPAQALSPILPTECGACADYGVTLFPHWRKANLTKEQQTIFRHYGYPLRE